LSLFQAYKPGQARLSRMITLLSGLFLISWGCRSLIEFLSDPSHWAKGPLAINQWPSFGGAGEQDAWRVDLVVYASKLSLPFVIGALLLVGAAVWYWRFLNKERWAELLIDMETELRKVSWPTLSDAWQSTLVVTGFTATVVVTILVYDLVIKGFIELFVERT
jgi:preprotein translocase SecE subunit